jgi:flagellar basal-body rod protein FlgC
MPFLNSLNIIGSALTAERFRTDTILQNISNASTTRTEDGEPYRRKQVVLEEREMDFGQALAAEEQSLSKGGVRVAQVVESDKPFTPVYDPTHPDANADGYVMYPNVNTTEEMVDLMAASRAYENNLTALSVVKSMAVKALDIGK